MFAAPQKQNAVQHSPVNQTSQTVWKSADKHNGNINSAAKLQINFNKLKTETPNNKKCFLKNQIFKTTASKLQTVWIGSISNGLIDSFIPPGTKKKKKIHVTLIPQCGEGVTHA